jgi:glycosyltransferase involved in cell wall biosynthesis
MNARVSVVIRTKDEVERLRLVLTSLASQTLPLAEPGPHRSAADGSVEVIVVDDGSSDGTRQFLDAEARQLPFLVIHHDECKGRSAATNTGAAAASGDVLLFLDGDTIAAPDLAEAHLRRHRQERGLFVRGGNHHLRCTRLFQDPQTGTPMPGQEENVARMGRDIGRSLVTVAQIRGAFDLVARRAEPGIYPGAGPRRLYELEMDALVHHPDLSVIWMAAAGHNASIRRRDFEESGGFDATLGISSHRELALRLTNRGLRMTAIPAARSYHLTHRTGWRSPADDAAFERTFHAAHPCLAVKLMNVFWLSLAGDERIPAGARITDLVQLEEVVKGNGCGVDYDEIRRACGLPDLPPRAPASATPAPAVSSFR